MFSLYMAIILALSMLILVIGYLTNESVFSPNRLVSIIWILLIIIPVLFWDTEYRWDGKGLIWILLSILAMILGGMVTSKKSLRIVKNGYIIKDNANHKFGLIIAILIIALLGVVIRIYNAGYGISDFLSADAFIKMNAEVAQARYSGNDNSNGLMSQLLLSFVYLSTLACGYAYEFEESIWRKIICTIFSFLPVVLTMLYSNAKSGFISCIMLWITGWLIAKVAREHLPEISARLIMLLIVLFIVFVMIILFIMVLRTGEFTMDMLKNRIDEFFVYAFGGTAAFDEWFARPQINGNIELGANNYLAIAKYMGYGNTDYYEVMWPINTNIYTAFRGIICDYGKVGGLVYMFVKGGIAELAYNELRYKNHQSLWAIFIIEMTYFWGFYSFIISPWRYTTYLITMFMFIVFICLYHKWITP